MFTRNYCIMESASFANKNINNNDTPNPPKYLVTVDGNVTPNTKYVSSDKFSSYYLSKDNFLPYKMIHYVRQVDVSANKVMTSSESGYGNPLFNYGVFFGSGNTPATMDDYKLEGEIAKNFTYSYTKDGTLSNDGSTSSYMITYTITNNNKTDLVIGEIGIFGESLVRTAYSAYTHYFYLIERTALETPITITAGGVGQVTYTIRMNYPVG